MNVTFIIPPSKNNKKIIRNIDCSHESKASYLWQPSDFMNISSLLQENDNAELIDGTVDRLTKDNFLKKVENTKADVIFFALSSVCWESDLNYFMLSREIHESVPMYVIGDIFLEVAYQKIILKHSEGIVFKPFDMDLKVMQKKGFKELPGVATHPGQDVLGDSSKPSFHEGLIPRHKLFRKKGYIFPFAHKFKFATVTSLWGCPFTCSYCTDSKIPPMVRNYESVISELDELKRQNISELFFADKTFGYPKKNSLALLDEMAKKFNFSWSCYFHPQHYSEELLDAMVKAGCHTIIIGIDSEDLSSLKQYRRVVTKNKLSKLLERANLHKVSICADFILGLKHETEQDIINTVNYALSIPIDFASFNIAAPLPGSSIRQEAIDSGLFSVGDEGFDTLGKEGVIGNEYISSDRLIKIRNRAVVRFYLRPRYLWRRIRKIKSLEHLLVQLLQMRGLLYKSK